MAEGQEGPDFTIDVGDLRSVLAAAKEFSPALARDLRRRLRRSGDEIVATQRAELDKPLPGMARVSGTQTRMITARGRRVAYRRRVNVYEDVATGRSRSTGMREAIKASLKTRVSTSKTRQGINVRADDRRGRHMTHPWQARTFRHPVFGDRGTHVIQRGQPYFWQPVIDGAAAAREQVRQAIDEAIAQISH